jgi:hypothetical protein
MPLLAAFIALIFGTAPALAAQPGNLDTICVCMETAWDLYPEERFTVKPASPAKLQFIGDCLARALLRSSDELHRECCALAYRHGKNCLPKSWVE